MLFARKEVNLVNGFRMLDTREMFLVHETEEIENIVASILTPEIWSKWTDASAKDVPPPDFYCDELHFMMEVMRVDDHGFKKKGNIINPTYDREHQVEKQLREAGILDMFPNANLFITANTGLPTEQDHNYTYYLENFKRTIGNHAIKIQKYRENHPNYKLIFFVYDESSAYFEDACTISPNGIIASGRPHMFMLDESFTQAFKNSDIDYFIWFAPYKRFEHIEPPFELPKACIYKVGEALPVEYKYNSFKMRSIEK